MTLEWLRAAVLRGGEGWTAGADLRAELAGGLVGFVRVGSGPPDEGSDPLLEGWGPLDEPSDEDPVTLAEEARADAASSCLAFCCDFATAAWALAIALLRPSTPGAEPW